MLLDHSRASYFWEGFGLHPNVLWLVNKESKNLCMMTLEEAIRTVLETDEAA